MNTGTLQLTADEHAMLRGNRGRAIQDAIQFQIEVGSFFEAQRLVPVTNVHMMGDIEVMGDAGLGILRQYSDEHVHCAVPTSTNAQCMHFGDISDIGQNAGEEQKEREVLLHYKQMRMAPTDTCINYQTVYQPKLGEHVAWGDTGTVIYANSVFGARTNFEAGKANIAAALTGRTPAYGFHLDAVRKGTIRGRPQGEDARPRRLGRARQACRPSPSGLFRRAGVSRRYRHAVLGFAEASRRHRSQAMARWRCFIWSASRPKRRRRTLRSAIARRAPR